MDSAIRTVNLIRKFGSVTAINGLTLEIYKGEIFGLVGPDGAGKSTVMRILAGILEPTGGEAFVAGFHTVKQSEKVQDNIAYMSQQFGLYQDLTVMENIEFYADLYGIARKGRTEVIDELLKFSYMQPFKKRLAGNLSGGMKQKLQLVCALIHTPKVLLLDEPTNGVDPVSRRDFWAILYNLLKQNVTILVSTSYLDEAERCHRVGLLNQGKMIACGTPSEIKQLMQGVILEIQSENAREIMKFLKSNLEVINIGLFGDRVHVVTKTPVETSSKIQQLLENNDLRYESLATVRASLEDVFISVISE